MSVPSLKVFVLALVLGVAASLAVACGQDRSNLISSGDAQVLTRQLAEVKAAVDDGDCESAGTALTAARQAALDLPASVDRRLRSRINDGIQALAKSVPVDCAAAQTETQPTETETVVTQTVETVPTVTETVPEETTPTDTGGIEPGTTTGEQPPPGPGTDPGADPGANPGGADAGPPDPNAAPDTGGAGDQGFAPEQ